MKYRVIKFFTDLQDNKYAYNVGDTFPHEGANVSNARFKELSSSNNKQHTPLIAIVDEDDAPVAEAEQVAEIEEPKKTRGRKKK